MFIKNKLNEYKDDTSAVTACLSLSEMGQVMKMLEFSCPGCKTCGNYNEPYMFNLLFETRVGPKHNSGNVNPISSNSHSNATYLRPETAQGVYINFENIINATGNRAKLPFGIGQIGKSFRNEIAVGGYLFRTREFDQMELQYFCHPQESTEHYNYWVEYCHSWLTNKLGLKHESIRRKLYEGEELAHYALATTDLEFHFPFGWGELWGIANRGDYDLKQHAKASGRELMYQIPGTTDKIYPHAIEPAVGTNRLILAVLSDCLITEKSVQNNTERTVLRLNDDIAPYKAAVLPVVKDNPGLVHESKLLRNELIDSYNIRVDYDDTQTIGKRYRRQDEIGTPLCITVDSVTLEDARRPVTIRERDSKLQIRLPKDQLLGYKKLSRSENWLKDLFEKEKTESASISSD